MDRYRVDFYLKRQDKRTESMGADAMIGIAKVSFGCFGVS